MPRDLPLGNGKLLVNFDHNYNLRDIYWPHVGQELQTGGHLSRVGVWASGQFAWIDSPEWQRELFYEHETLVTHVTFSHPVLQLKLVFSDGVDFHRPLFLRNLLVTNTASYMREVRLFFHYDWHIWHDNGANTVFYYPYQQALVAYKRQAYFLMGGMVIEGDRARFGISSWATGKKEFQGAEGTWRDAEDGVLGGNPIAQGSVDGTFSLTLPSLAPQASASAYHWLAAGPDLPAVVELDQLVHARGPQSFLTRTYNYWYHWVNKDSDVYADLIPELVDLYKRSLLILRTQIDHGGAIIAANDSDVEHFSQDSYSYMWPRDGALVANALSHAGYSEIARSFYKFCASVLTPGGYLLHKYNPDRSWGSSWHAWVDQYGEPQLPIQIDETALVLYSLWNHYARFLDYEFIAPHFRSLITPAADFLVSYRDPQTRLPHTTFDLWEERLGIFSYTTATVYAGLLAASYFSDLFGEIGLAKKYRDTAEEIREAAQLHLWDESLGRFVRMIRVEKDGTIHKDATLDSSLCGLFQFGLFSANDSRIERTMEALERVLWVKTEIGGMARYENDLYHQVEKDVSNPWFICTLWLAQYRIVHATTRTELHYSLDLLNWVRAHTLPSGVMAEQLHPFTSAPLSVSPLTWSHAEYVETIHLYLTKYANLPPLEP